jgi:hypothetical protein
MAEIFMGARYRQHSRGATGGWDVGGRCTFGGPDEFGIRGPFEGWNRERIDRAERVSLPGAAGLAAAFPGATSYAPAGALPRLSRKSPDVAYRPASDLIETIHPRVTFLVPEGMKARRTRSLLSEGSQ